jgi:hypothetical protein
VGDNVEMTQRSVVRAVVLFATTIGVMNCARPTSVRAFPGPGCPTGWSFLYQDQLSRSVTCRQDSTSVVRRLR